MTTDKLFTPVRVGNCDVQQRIVMAPLTRLRCTDQWVPTPLMKEYYTQRAAVPGTLIMSEGTHIGPRWVGLPHVPGIWNAEQIAAWKEITDAVHAKGCFMWLQLWNMGRGGYYSVAKNAGTKIYAPSPIKLKAAPEEEVPEEMTEEDIKACIADYVQAAKNAIEAGFDGVQLHCANGYLPDQFLQSVTNHRTDKYGGSVENRSRFAHEALTAIVEAVGPTRVGARFSPWGTFNDMHMGVSEATAQFRDIISKASKLDIAYIDLVEPRLVWSDDGSEGSGGEGNSFVLLDAWTKGKPVWFSGGFTADSARKRMEEVTEWQPLVVIGRYFTSNPDLVYRFKHNLELTPYDRSRFYNVGSPDGYTTWENSPEYNAEFASSA